MDEEEFEKKVTEGMKIVFRRLVEEKRKTNQPLIFSENGVIKYVDPHTIDLTEYE